MFHEKCFEFHMYTCIIEGFGTLKMLSLLLTIISKPSSTFTPQKEWILIFTKIYFIQAYTRCFLGEENNAFP